MFDIGFFELILIAIVALLVIGPERLPHVARSAGLWLGKLRGFVGSVKADIDQELKAEELKRIMKQHTDSVGVHEIIEETRSVAEDVKQQDYLLRAIVDEEDKKEEDKKEEDKKEEDKKEEDKKEVKQPVDDERAR
ncbi:Sec-independent protein translocase protein TatB [Sulfuriflexus mobilis]|uniref:Sec-independent protein translocase protein TatB n=1 Tax=Sulfuriflexus mobilis TaxID=1811807 RepID=UPI000F817E7A|nr:Sec-independent protein translocase protein TatB [Sulfuriflexus mobilis]